MEYSVYDLIRILLKKWYVILLVMALLGGAAGVFSQRSYQAALADYEDYTSRAAPVNTEVGSYTAVYQCGFTVTDFSRYQGQYAQKNAFINGFYLHKHAASSLQKPPQAAPAVAFFYLISTSAGGRRAWRPYTGSAPTACCRTRT